MYVYILIYNIYIYIIRLKKPTYLELKLKVSCNQSSAN